MFENPYTKWRRERAFKKAVSEMSELGLELLDALQHDEWTMDQYTIRHKKSGIELWTANGPTHFRIYSVPKTEFKDKEKERLLNEADVRVLSSLARTLRNKSELAPAQVALNVLRLGRIKDETQT